MRKIYLFLIAIFLVQSNVKAAVGDTTWVQAHSDVWLDWYNNFDTTVKFPAPGKTYRKVYMTITLGKYQCPGSPQYCGDWDYTVQTYIMTPAGDTLELGRLITPYANSSYPRTPITWKQRYIFDVTDLYPILKDSATVRLHYSGYSGGFTGNIKFAFIEGTPNRNVLGVEKIYDGSWNYGDPNAPIDNFLPAVSKTAPSGTQRAELKFTVTGHGADGNYCSEFCSKYYNVLLNNNQIAQKNIWRDNCGSNHLYPQSGTWVYDRANWCPGDQVQTFSHVLTGVSSENPYSVNVDFEPYTRTGSGTPSYTITSHVVYYGANNHSVDADLLDIIAPNNFEAYFRENALCGDPKIKVKNNGSTAITSLKIKYGVTTDFQPEYNWTGNIAAGEEVVISLPEPWSLRAASGDTATKSFKAQIIQVNGITDEDISNNSMSVPFKSAPKWPVEIIVKLTTNTATNGGVSETNWKIYDLSGNVVAKRENLAASTTYTDTLVLGPSCYKLVVSDAGCDGLYWWANPNAGSGLFQVRKRSSIVPFPLAGYFNRDFGCGFTQYFTTDWTTDVQNITNANTSVSIEAVPNPAKDFVTVNLAGVSIANGVLKIVDATGRVVSEQICNQMATKINVSNIANGVYTIIYADEKGKLQTSLLIAK